MKKVVIIVAIILFLLGIAFLLAGFGIKPIIYSPHHLRYELGGTLAILLAIILLIFIFVKEWKTLPERIVPVVKKKLLFPPKFTKIHAIVFFIILISIYLLIWGRLTVMTDTAYFGGDTWEYQSMGVNFAKGHGIQKFGALEPFDVYRFEKITPLPAYYNDFFQSAGEDDIYRTPAYPLFLAMVYKLFGVSPKTAKIFQLFMLVIIAASLPFVGYHYWGKIGFISGIPAGGLYLARNYKLAEQILTEPLIAFTVFLVLVALMIFEYRQRTIPAIILGLTLGVALLVKGSLIFR